MKRFVQPELAATLERIAADPCVSSTTAAWRSRLRTRCSRGGGLITTADMAAYQVKGPCSRLIGKYHGYKIFTAPPPSSGGIVLQETLNILSGYKLARTRCADRGPEQVHLITEAFRRAFMDRSDYLGDPGLSFQMPLKQMADKKYARAWRKPPLIL